MAQFNDVDAAARQVLGAETPDRQVGLRRMVQTANPPAVLDSLRRTSLSALVGASQRQLSPADPGAEGLLDLAAFDELGPNDCRLRAAAWDYEHGSRLRSLGFWFFYPDAGQKFTLNYTSGGVVSIVRKVRLGQRMNRFYLQRIMTHHVTDFVAQFRAAIPAPG